MRVCVCVFACVARFFFVIFFVVGGWGAAVSEP